MGELIQSRTYARARLVVEELFANSIRHGYGQESDAPVWLAVEADGERLHITYMDEAQPFDPFADRQFSGKALEVPLEERHVGGLGRLLISEIAQRMHYRRENGRNIILLEI